MRKTVPFAVVLGILLTASASAPGQPSAGPLSYHLSLTRAMYGPGEPVEVRLLVRNDTAESVTLYFPSTQRFDFVVRNPGGDIWRWSRGKAFLTVVQTATLGPHQTLDYTASWDQRSSDGGLVPPGTYEMVGVFLGSLSPGLRPVDAAVVPFRIAATPAGVRPSAEAREAAFQGRAIGEVFVNSRLVLRVRTAAGGLSALQRAEVVAARLRTLLRLGLDIRELTTASVGAEAAVVWGSRLVITVDAAHARLNHTTPSALAAAWRRALVEAVSVMR